MNNRFVSRNVPGKFTAIRCRQCNISTTFCGDKIESKIEAFKSDHAHELPTAQVFNKDRFVNCLIGKSGE